AIDISIKSLVNYNLKQDTVIIRIYDPSDINLYYYEEKYILSEGDSIYGELFPEPPKETNTLIIEAIMLRKDIIEVLAEADTIAVPKVLEVDCPADVPVLTYFNYEVFVYEEEIIYPLTNAHVILTNSMSDPSDFGYIYEEGYTGTDGKVSFNIYAENTKDLEVIVNKDGYRETAKESKPYMWSYSENATGSNNGNNIIRNTDTGELLLTYYQYNPYPDPFVPTRINRVIEAYSDNEGEWWYVWDKAYGQNPSITITKTATGDPIDGIFYDNGVGYIYDNAILPSPVTVSNGSMWVEPGSMWNDNITNRLHSSGIKYIDEGTPDPYLIHAKFAYDDPENAIVKVILKPIGKIAGNDPSYLVIPGHNPSIALKFNYLSNLNDRIIAFEDKNSEICWKWYDSWKAEWIDPYRVSFSENIKSINPHIDAYGDKVSLVWEEEIATG
ncbi:hypothetical protein KAU15_06270, partial [candidate division WOR-3 bacterium]|nr:hypothetical protein [candidate division WOR-3 bacterium]